MSEVRALIEQLIAAGVDPVEAAEVIARAAIHGAASAPAKRSAGAIRQERYRRNKASQVTDGDAMTDLSSPEGSSPTPPSPKPLQSLPPSPPKGGSSPAEVEFETAFWPAYPNKVGKPNAKAKFVKARALADLETIMAGLRRYVAKTDDRPWCNPATWLYQQRWADEPAHVARGSPPQQQAPQMADVFQFIGKNFSNDPGSEHDDSRSARQAVSYLPASGSER